MESYELNACVDRLNRLKKDVQYRQKKGLPFILASVIIWALILLSRIAAADLRTANLMTFICCCLLIPLATLFSKLLKADIFRKTGNPLNSLVVLATLNQLLYLLIAMWAFDRRPDAMLMIYAICCLTAGSMTARPISSSPSSKPSVLWSSPTFWAAWPPRLSFSAGRLCSACCFIRNAKRFKAKNTALFCRKRAVVMGGWEAFSLLFAFWIIASPRMKFSDFVTHQFTFLRFSPVSQDPSVQQSPAGFRSGLPRRNA